MTWIYQHVMRRSILLLGGDRGENVLPNYVIINKLLYVSSGSSCSSRRLLEIIHVSLLGH